MEKNIEKMNMPVASNEGEIFDAGDIYEKMHIKKRVLRKLAKNENSTAEPLREEIMRHLSICPPDPSSGRLSCGNILSEYINRINNKLPFEEEE